MSAVFATTVAGHAEPGRRPVAAVEIACVALALSLAAALAPLPLYLVSLSLFGLPHVLWELGWIRRVYGDVLSRGRWFAIAAILALQALARLGAWSGSLDPALVATLDLLTLALAMLACIGATRTPGTWRRMASGVVAAAIGAGLIWAIDRGEVVAVLMLLGIAHNFTPVLLAPGEARLDGTPARRILARLFLLPWLLALLVWLAVPSHGEGAALAGMPAEASWLGRQWPDVLRAALSGLVLAQCLHYYAVIRLLPGTLAQPLAAPRAIMVALAASAALGLYFLADFGDARRLYAVAAGVHAWLEWPLVLLILSGLRR
jgi:hypothetical protein